MIYLLDTDTLIDMVRGLKAKRAKGQRERAERLVKRCRDAQAEGNAVGLSAITVSELEFGARNSDDYDQEILAVRKVLLPFEAYDYDAVLCPPHYGRIRDELEKKGRTIGSMDLMIAAQTLALDATLVTNNQSHFSRINGMRTENWSK